MNFRLGEAWVSPQGVIWWVEAVTMWINCVRPEYARLQKLKGRASRIEMPIGATKGWRRVWSQEDTEAAARLKLKLTLALIQARAL